MQDHRAPCWQGLTDTDPSRLELSRPFFEGANSLNGGEGREGDHEGVPARVEAGTVRRKMRRGGEPAGSAYVLPRHASEIDRLDVQHYAIKQAMDGRNHLAPIGQPTTIIDIGCGTGQWAYEVCAAFPETMVVGMDLAPSKGVAGSNNHSPARRPPPNYRFVRGNLLKGLSFADGSFDFVHQPLLVSGVPVKSWPAVTQEVVRLGRPGGWVERTGCDCHMD